MEYRRLKLRVSGDVRLMDRPFVRYAFPAETWRGFFIRYEVRVNSKEIMGQVQTLSPHEAYVEPQDYAALRVEHQSTRIFAYLDDKIGELISKFKPADEYGVTLRITSASCTPEGNGVPVPGSDEQNKLDDYGAASVLAEWFARNQAAAKGELNSGNNPPNYQDPAEGSNTSVVKREALKQKEPEKVGIAEADSKQNKSGDVKQKKREETRVQGVRLQGEEQIWDAITIQH